MINALRRTWSRLRRSRHLRSSDRDLAEELEAHVRMLADDNIRRGAAPEEALRMARLRFGSIESTKESYRDQRGLPVIDSLTQDLRYALRGIRKNPGFAAVAILSLAIGIGANTAIFSIVNAVLLRSLPFHDPDRIYAIREILPQMSAQGSIPVNPLHAREWARLCPSVESVALMRGTRVQTTAGGEPESLVAAQVPHNLFHLFGVKPILGRTFLPEEDQPGKDRVVMLGESLWRARFNADPSLIGRTLVLNDQQYHVAGIVPAWFRLPFASVSDAVALNVRFEVFLPLVIGQEQLRPMGNYNYNAVLRLKSRG
jgi:hypothetical protein